MPFGIDDIGEFFEDVADIPGDLVEAGASLFDGPSGVVGIFVSGATLYVRGPTALVPAIIAGVAVTEILNAVIKTRRLSESSEERWLANQVFGNHLPAPEKIILTNLAHPQGRAYTIPNIAGECLINLGEAFDDPIHATSKTYPKDGQLLIHELTHVWQIHHHSFMPGLICEGILNQVRNEFEEGIYDPGTDDKAWSNYNLEQQASIVDGWYAGYAGDEPCSKHSRFYRHIFEAVNHGTHPPAVQTLSVRTTARSRFGTEGAFSVKDRFPRRDFHGRRSLRKVLLGMRD